MKAFLSDRTSRDERTPDAWTMGDLGVAWNAEREARAILAVTEPGPYNYLESPGALDMHAHTWDYYPHGHGLKETRAALADALALFIGQTFPGEQCHCAQGHHWSSERGYFDCGGIVPA